MKKNRMKLNLQFFAEEGNGGGAEGNAAGATGTDEGGKETQPDGSGTSFDDFLKDGKNQAEFDRRIAKALETQKNRMQKEIEQQIETAKTEAQKLAKMNAEQKAQYEQEKREKELAVREAEISKRELSATAKETLNDKGLPTSLANILDYSSAEACQTSIETVEKAFQEAVAKAVEDKLRGGNPLKKAPENHTVYTKEQIAAMTTDEINKNWDAVQASMKSGL